MFLGGEFRNRLLEQHAGMVELETTPPLSVYVLVLITVETVITVAAAAAVGEATSGTGGWGTCWTRFRIPNWIDGGVTIPDQAEEAEDGGVEGE